MEHRLAIRFGGKILALIMLALLMFPIAGKATFCISGRLSIHNSHPANPFQGSDSATMYVEGSYCQEGLHNEMQAKVVLTNSNGSCSQKTSALYYNRASSISSGQVDAIDKSAQKAEGYWLAYCHICKQGHQEMQYFNYMNF